MLLSVYKGKHSSYGMARFIGAASGEEGAAMEREISVCRCYDGTWIPLLRDVGARAWRLRQHGLGRDRVLHRRAWGRPTSGIEGRCRRIPELCAGREMEMVLSDWNMETDGIIQTIPTIIWRAIFANELRGREVVNLSVGTQSNGSDAYFQIFRT
jgi:hypothetical protein